MAKQITAKKLTSNIIISILAQVISLAVSFILNLVVPKFIDPIQYAHWQTYILYTGYVGVLHFGLLDGLVLRYSKYDYDEINKERVRSQFLFLLISTSIITALFLVVALVALNAPISTIVVLVAVAIITKNIVTYTSYTFQITNRITKYAVLTIMQRAVYGVVVIFLLIFRVKNFYWYCVADLTGDLISIVVSAFFNKGMYFGKSLGIKETFKETKLNISSGIILMLANWSAILLTNGAKMIIQWRWEELIFSKVSFAFSISNLFLTLVTALSVVLFPSLKRIEEDKLPETYKNIRSLMLPVILSCLLFYFPGCWILKKWLPNYAESLPYLGLLLPLIIYSTKLSLLTNNYLKVYRKEKILFIINVSSAILGIGMFALGAYVFSNIKLVLISVVLILFLNSVISEIVVCRIIKIKLIKETIIELLVAVAFILLVLFLNLLYGFLAYLALLIICILVYLKDIIRIFKKRKESTEIKETES